MSTAPTNFIAFMCHTERKHYDYLEETLQEYNIGQYLIGYEASPYEHFHFICQMSSADYHKYSERVFRKKLKLKGRWFKEGNETFPRQYGKVSEIQDLEKMKSYTIKDGDFRSNMPEQDVQRYFEKSHKKEEKKKIYELVFESLEQGNYEKYIQYGNDYGDITGDNSKILIERIKIKIINYLRTSTDVNMCRSNILSYTQYFLKKTNHYSESDKDRLIYSLFF